MPLSYCFLSSKLKGIYVCSEFLWKRKVPFRYVHYMHLSEILWCNFLIRGLRHRSFILGAIRLLLVLYRASPSLNLALVAVSVIFVV